jgi:hypothetical protein
MAGVEEVKQITTFIVGFAAAFASIQASAEDLTAGKTPAQLFRSDCGECHHSPNGLVRDPGDVRAVANFLREHYTTKSETAGALAAYVSGFASARGPAVALPPARDRKRSRSDAELEQVPANPAAEKKRARDDGDTPRPPRRIGTAAKPGGQTADDPISHLRTYFSSGTNSGDAGRPKARKRRHGPDDAQGARTNTEAPAAAPAAAAPAAMPQPADTATDEPK